MLSLYCIIFAMGFVCNDQESVIKISQQSHNEVKFS